MGKTDKQPVVREDLYQFRFLSEASLSPAGAWAAYVVNRADKEDNGYHSSVWAVNTETGENRLLAERGEAKSPVWLTDETLLFASGREKEKDGAQTCTTRYYEIRVNGGEAKEAMTVPAKADKLKSLGDGLWLVAATADETEDEASGQEQADAAPGQDQADASAEWGSSDVPADWQHASVLGQDYEIFEELPFRFNGKGVINRKRPALYIFSEADGSLTRITPKYLETVSYDVSPDKRLVAFSGPCYESIRPTESALYLYDCKTQTTKKLVDENRHNTDHVCFLGNDTIFYTGTTRERMGKNPRFYRYDLGTGTIKELPFPDAEIGNSVGSDAKFGAGRSMVWCEETKRLYLTKTSWGDSRLFAMDQDGNWEPVSREAGAVTGFDMKVLPGTGKKKFVLSAMRGQHLVELYLLDPETGVEKKLTDFNDAYLDSHTVSAPESFRYAGKNGYEMEGYVIKPVNYEPGKKYPAVFEIHGGPKGVSGSVFFHEFQCLASAGYFVFYGNPRGSDGRGEKYADITEVFGTEDFADLMELFDETLRRYPDIDEAHVGICGGSYGGFMCNWMAGHTDRFAAAVSQRSISNYFTKCLYTDIGFYANWLQMGAYPWEDFDKVWSMSPLKAAENAKMPLLLIQSDEDFRCYMGEAFQMFSAVKRQGTDTRMVLFHGENHELSRSGKPENRMTRLRELMGWFERYLK